MGHRLAGDDRGPITPDANGALESRELGIRLWLEGGELVLADVVTGERLLTDVEAAEVATKAADERTEAAKRKTEAAKQAANTAQKAAIAAQEWAQSAEAGRRSRGRGPQAT